MVNICLVHWDEFAAVFAMPFVLFVDFNPVVLMKGATVNVGRPHLVKLCQEIHNLQYATFSGTMKAGGINE